MKKIGNRVLAFNNRPAIISSAGVVGPKEGQGPLKHEFDICFDDSIIGEDSWEKAECILQKTAAELAINKAGLKNTDIDIVFAGDLLNQCIASSFGLMGLERAFVGMYGACSTMALTLINAGVFVDSGAADKALAVTSSHFCSAERQYRFPLEYGGVRPPTSQWTVTGSGAVVVGKEGRIYLNNFLIGKIVDYGIKDANNMGAAMAPAAADTILTYLKETNTLPENYDMIYTGDLGRIGTDLLYRLCEDEGIKLRGFHKDCGNMIFDVSIQDVHSGGSGCGCSASVLTTHIMNRLKNGQFKNILFCATGALMSPTSTQQGENIPCIAHIVNIKAQ